MLFRVVAHIVIDILNLTIGTYVLFKRPRHILNRSFFLVTFGAVGWSLGLLLIAFTNNILFLSPALWSAELVVLGLVFLAKVFPEENVLPKNFWQFLVPWFFLVILTPFSPFIKDVTFNAQGHLELHDGPLFGLFVAIIGGYLVWSFWKFFQKYFHSQGLMRAQIGYLLAGAGIFIVIASLCDILLPAFHIFTFSLFGPLASIAFIACTGYAIVRHQFMDIRVVIKRGVSYALALALLAAIFFTIEFAIEKFAYNNDELADIVSALIGALLFSRIRSFFESFTDRVFFRGDYDYVQAVRELGELLNGTIELRVLLGRLEGFLMRTIKPSRITFFLDGLPDRSADANCKDLIKNAFAVSRAPAFFHLWEKEGDAGPIARKARTMGVAALIPLIANSTAIGTLLLGEKLSDDVLRQKDMDLLGVLSHQAGMAIENARLYEEIKRQNEELEKRVYERTEKIRGMQEDQTRFLTDISHELQTPVAILKGNVEVLERKRKGERKAALRVMNETLDRMARMTNHLLAIAKLNFSKEKLHKQRIAVENLLEESYNDCHILTERKGVLLSYMSENASIGGDKDRLREVILNLVSNALKHTPAGGRIMLKGSIAEGGSVKITVEDTGSGIAPEEIIHIFERFYRIAGEKVSGTGLGLDICAKFIEAHGGTITAESQLGKGSRFIITLPVFL